MLNSNNTNSFETDRLLAVFTKRNKAVPHTTNLKKDNQEICFEQSIHRHFPN